VQLEAVDIAAGVQLTGDANDYKLSNTIPDKRADNSSGRLFSTPTNTPPL
jgi:hypothetical protein